MPIMILGSVPAEADLEQALDGWHRPVDRLLDGRGAPSLAVVEPPRRRRRQQKRP
jgi:hypothetical protein